MEANVNLVSTLASSLIILGAIVMALNIMRLRAILALVEKFGSAESQKAKWLFTSHELLMSFFVVGYAIVLCAVVAKIDFVGELFVGIIFFLGPVFVFLGISLQSGMLNSVTDSYLKATAASSKAITASELLQQEQQNLIEVNQELRREIIDRRRVEKDLRLLRNLMDQSNDAVYVIDPETRGFLDINKKACDTLGYEREELLNLGVVDIEAVIPDTFSWTEHVSDVRNGKSIIVEGEHRRKDGTTFPVEVSVKIILQERKEYMVAVARDITERLAEEMLEESEHKYRQLFENSTDFVFTLDLDGNFTNVNRAAERLTGYTKGELIGMNYRDYTPSAAHDEIFQSFNRVFETGKRLQDMPLEVVLKDGTRKHFETSVGPLKNGKEIIGFQGALRDVTARKLTEEKFSLAAAVINNTLDGIVVTDPQGIIQQVNPSFTSITGYTKEEALGKTPRILKSDRHDQAFYKHMWDSLVTKGSWEGEIWNRRKNGETYPEWLSITAIKDAQGETTHYVGVFHDISELKQTHERMKHQAYHDGLTGLPNRQLFNDRLNAAIASSKRTGQKLAVMFLELDNFKNVNDTLGHYSGDLLLQQVAKRLEENTREEDTIARLGGDEFMVILPRLEDVRQAAIVAKRYLAALGKPIVLGENTVFVGASIGISFFPDDGQDVEQLVKNCDLAMYRAKAQGKNTFVMFRQSFTQEVERRFALETQLRHAVQRQEFILHFQPKVELGTGRIVGSEALVRWQLPEGEIVYPNEFIPLAEDTDIILPLGRWVLEDACRQTAMLQPADGNQLSVAVNLSVRQFQDKALIDTVKKVLAKTGLAPENLILEVTERIFMSDVEQAIGVLSNLANEGIRVAIDDFGTGYSSLNYLKKLPLSIVKIDRSFVKDIPRNLDDVAIAKAIIAMAHSLNLQVVAEGVETAEQLKFMQKQGCEEIQGYFFSRPLPGEDYAKLVKQRLSFDLNLNMPRHADLALVERAPSPLASLNIDSVPPQPASRR
jgi:diguanylate cyclase (GGDEF)-like protein/PAS domain S-box-containing protein